MKQKIRRSIYEYRNALYVEYDDLIKNYTDSNFLDFKNYIEYLKNNTHIFDIKYDAIYVKSLNSKIDWKYFNVLSDVIECNPVEFTLEINSKLLEKDYLSEISNSKFNRISVNFYFDRQKEINYLSILIEKISETNILADVTVNFKLESDISLLKDFLIKCSDNGVDHVSLYQQEDDYSDELNNVFLQLRKLLNDLNFENYETKHFSKNDHYSIINFIYSNLFNWYSIGYKSKGFNYDGNNFWLLENSKENIALNNKVYFDLDGVTELLISNLYTNILGINKEFKHHKIAAETQHENIEKLLKKGNLKIEDNIIYTDNLEQEEIIENHLFKI